MKLNYFKNQILRDTVAMETHLTTFFLLKFTFSTCSVPVPCQLGEFTCDSGECIAENKRCDGIKDCADNTDELCSFMGWSCYIGINYFML